MLNWKDLDEGERSSMDVDELLQQYSGDAFYVLRSHLGQVDGLARQLVEDRNRDWLPLQHAACGVQSQLRR